MARFAVAGLALVALVVVGALVIPGRSGRAPAASIPPVPSAAPAPGVAAPPPAAGLGSAPSTALAPEVVSVWRIGGLSPRALARLRQVPGVERVSVVEGGLGLLRRTRARSGRIVHDAGAGGAFPLDVMAVDPAGYAALLPADERSAFRRGLRPGSVLLSATSARVRRLGRGGVLELANGRRLRVADVVADDLVRAAEIVVARSEGRRLGTRPRSALLAQAGASRRALRRAAGPRSRVRDVGRAPWRRRFGVERQSRLKDRFGEFAVRLPLGEDWIRLAPGWVGRSVVTRRVPILGAVTCHRAMLGPLRAALGELERRGLARLVDRGDYAGCYAPRRIPSSGAVSRHAWGLAIDLNAAANPYGAPSRQDRRLVAAMERRGFNWGGNWPTPDAMHFEYGGGDSGQG